MSGDAVQRITKGRRGQAARSIKGRYYISGGLTPFGVASGKCIGRSMQAVLKDCALTRAHLFKEAEGG
jgi:hypothetical protein